MPEYLTSEPMDEVERLLNHVQSALACIDCKVQHVSLGGGQTKFQEFSAIRRFQCEFRIAGVSCKELAKPQTKSRCLQSSHLFGRLHFRRRSRCNACFVVGREVLLTLNQPQGLVNIHHSWPNALAIHLRPGESLLEVFRGSPESSRLGKGKASLNALSLIMTANS